MVIKNHTLHILCPTPFLSTRFQFGNLFKKLVSKSRKPSRKQRLYFLNYPFSLVWTPSFTVNKNLLRNQTLNLDVFTVNLQVRTSCLLDLYDFKMEFLSFPSGTLFGLNSSDWQVASFILSPNFHFQRLFQTSAMIALAHGSVYHIIECDNPLSCERRWR